MRQTYGSAEAAIGETVRCPVTGGPVKVASDTPSVEIKGKKYYVCCADCGARLKADQTSLTVSDGKLRLDDSTLNLELKIVDFSKPDLTFDLILDKIDADRYLPPKSSTQRIESRPAEAKSKGTASKTAPSSAPPAKSLAAALAAADGRLQAGNVIINQKKIEDIRMTFNGKSGPIKLALSARLPEGPLGVNGSIGPLGGEAGRQTLPLDLTVTAVDQLRLRASGKVSNPMQQPVAELAVKIDEFPGRIFFSPLIQRLTAPGDKTRHNSPLQLI